MRGIGSGNGRKIMVFRGNIRIVRFVRSSSMKGKSVNEIVEVVNYKN